MKKLLFVTIFAMLLVISSLAVEIESGTCGKNLTWTVDSAYNLTIRGTGEMDCWTSNNETPWSSYADSIKTISFIGNITTVGDYAFSGFTALTGVEIPKSVQTMGSFVFYQCENLKNITLPFIGSRRGITRTYDSVFGYIFGCKTNYALSNMMYAPDKSAQYYIPSNIEAITITDETVVPYGAFSAETSMFDNALTNVTTIILNESVNVIDSYAFYCCSDLEEIVIPENVTNISDYTFYGCSSLYEINIPDSVENIGDYAFAKCSGAYVLEISDNATSIGDYSFSECTGLFNIVIPNKVKTIGSHAFDGCSGVTSVSMGEETQLEKIGEEAFSNCSFLLNFTVPLTVSSIGKNAFKNCDKMRKITVESGNMHYVNDENGVLYNIEKTAMLHYPRDNKVTAYEVPFGVKTIDEYAFENSKHLISIKIPDSVLGIGKGSLKGCINLEKLTIPFVGSRRSANKTEDGVLGYIFDRDNNGKTQYFTSPVVSGYLSMYGATYAIPSLKEITVTDDATIPHGAFHNCDTVTSITLPEYVADIGDYAFEGCDLLTDVYFGGSQSDWSSVIIGNNNTSLDKATIHFEYSELPGYTEVTGLTLNKAETFIFTGRSEQLVASIAPNTATDVGIIWKSSNESVATVENGLIIAKGEGEATIIATSVSSGKSAYCKVTVRHLFGDLNLDGQINISDAILLQQYLASPDITLGPGK